MIFGKGYDETLLLILYGDKKNRDRILDVIHSIPDKLYEALHAAIKMSEYYKKSGEAQGIRNIIELSGRCETPDRILYWYRIDPYSYSLTVGYSIYDGNNYDEAFEITMNRFDESNLVNYKNIYIGTLRDNYKIHDIGMPTYDVCSYDLLKDTWGFKMVCSSKHKESSRRINVRKVINSLSNDKELSINSKTRKRCQR